MKPISVKVLVRNYTEWILGSFGVLIVFLLGWMMVWGIMTIATDLGMSLGAPSTQNSGDKFNLETAEELNLRGQE